MLIRNASLMNGRVCDVRVRGSLIEAIGDLPPRADEELMDAGGRLLLPGLHDHHIHLMATAAARNSVQCGPPHVKNAEELSYVLAQPGPDWLRGIGYQESIAGLLTVTQLDEWQPDRPLRIQHRSGRMWFFNSLALDLLLEGEEPPEGLDRSTGQLFDNDVWLRTRLRQQAPDLSCLSGALLSSGITGVTEMGPANSVQDLSIYQSAAFRPRIMVAGDLSLADGVYCQKTCLGPAKLHLHEAELPDYDRAVEFATAAHHQGRSVAIHCVTETELVYALSLLDHVGVHRGDRIEHVSILPDTALREMRRLGVQACVQPAFIHDRGDNYRLEVDAELQPLLYRTRSLLEAGISLSGGSDAPYGQFNPWAAMAAAVTRHTRSGAYLNNHEGISPEQALALYLKDARDFSIEKTLQVGGVADLCLLDRNWAQARSNLADVKVWMTMIDGELVHNLVD